MLNLTDAFSLDACIYPEEADFCGIADDVKASGLDAFFLTLNGDSFRTGVESLGKAYSITDDPAQKCRVARTCGDLLRNKADGVLSAILYFQDPAPIENKPDLLRAFYEMGVRVIQMSYNKGGFLGAGCVEGAGYGLTDWGKRAVRQMNRLGMLVDLSHCGPRTAADAMAVSEKPVTFCHANVRAVADNPRNKTDEQLLALRDNGGVIGLTPWAPICWKGHENAPPTVEDFLDHVCYVVDKIGIDHAGFASDNNLDHKKDIVGICSQNDLYDNVVGGYNKNVGTDPDQRHATGFSGAVDLQNLIDAMRARGFRDGEIRKFLGGNFLRVLKEVWR